MLKMLYFQVPSIGIKIVQQSRCRKFCKTAKKASGIQLGERSRCTGSILRKQKASGIIVQKNPDATTLKWLKKAMADN